MNYTSNCCDALIIQTDICSNCKEHCEPVDNTEAEVEGEDDHLATVPKMFAPYFNHEQLL